MFPFLVPWCRRPRNLVNMCLQSHMHIFFDSIVVHWSTSTTQFHEPTCSCGPAGPLNTAAVHMLGAAQLLHATRSCRHCSPHVHHGGTTPSSQYTMDTTYRGMPWNGGRTACMGSRPWKVAWRLRMKKSRGTRAISWSGWREFRIGRCDRWAPNSKT